MARRAVSWQSPGMTTRPAAAPRSAAIDAVRVLAIVAIVVGHVWTDGRFDRLLYSWHVPVFFFLTGYLWTPGRSLATEVRRRTTTLLVPYLSWLVLLSGAVLVAALVSGGPVPLGTFRDAVLGGSWAGRPYSAFWFVTALWAAAVLYRLVERLPWPVQAVLALLALTAAAVVPLQLAAVPLALGVAVPCVVLLMGGRQSRALLDRATGAGRPWIGAGLLIGGGLPFAVGAARPFDLKDADWGTPGLSVLGAVAISAGLVLLAEAATARLSARACAAIVLLAEGGLMVVLSHALVLWLLGTPPTGVPWHLALALVVPWAGALAVRRTAAAPLLLGRPKVVAPA